MRYNKTDGIVVIRLSMIIIIYYIYFFFDRRKEPQTRSRKLCHAISKPYSIFYPPLKWFVFFSTFIFLENIIYILINKRYWMENEWSIIFNMVSFIKIGGEREKLIRFSGWTLISMMDNIFWISMVLLCVYI